jgi:glyoxylase-like metal-dependent hydrolase (beta-lactamase superfamily II)
VHEVAPGLWRWTGRHPGWRAGCGWEQDVGCVYVETGEAIVLIDPLVPPEDEARFWQALDRDVERLGRPVLVLLTAPWHDRSAEAVRARYGAGVWAHPAGAARLAGPVDAPVLPAGIEVLEVPPAAEGQVVVHLAEHGVLVTAEVIAGADGGLRVRPSPALTDDARLLSFLRLLLELPVRTVLPAHGEPVVGTAREAIGDAVAHWAAPSAA